MQLVARNTPADSELGPPPHHPVPPFYYITASVAGRRPASGLSFLLSMSPYIAYDDGLQFDYRFHYQLRPTS